VINVTTIIFVMVLSYLENVLEYRVKLSIIVKVRISHLSEIGGYVGIAIVPSHYNVFVPVPARLTDNCFVFYSYGRYYDFNGKRSSLNQAFEWNEVGTILSIVVNLRTCLVEIVKLPPPCTSPEIESPRNEVWFDNSYLPTFPPILEQPIPVDEKKTSCSMPVYKNTIKKCNLKNECETKKEKESENENENENKHHNDHEIHEQQQIPPWNNFTEEKNSMSNQNFIKNEKVMTSNYLHPNDNGNSNSNSNSTSSSNSNGNEREVRDKLKLTVKLDTKMNQIKESSIPKNK